MACSLDFRETKEVQTNLISPPVFLILIDSNRLYCLLIGLGMRFTPTVACIMDLHYYCKASCVSIGQG
jgi:hypothetical protein